MDRVASLRRVARLLKGRIFRSLPWGFRVAHLFTVLSSETLSVFGRVIGAVFLLQGVEGMPDPGPSWNPSARDPERTLPRTYYSDFANKLFRRFVSKFRNPELVETSMMEVAAKFGRNPKLVAEGSELHSAQGLIATSIQNSILNAIKAENIRRPPGTQSIFDTDEEGQERTIDLEDPQALHSFESLITQQQLSGIRKDLSKILPWAPDYLDLLLDGYNDREILGDPKAGKPGVLAEKLGLPALTNPSGMPMSLAMWSKVNGYKDKIEKVITKHLQN